jgi:hypothetical protein
VDTAGDISPRHASPGSDKMLSRLPRCARVISLFLINSFQLLTPLLLQPPLCNIWPLSYQTDSCGFHYPKLALFYAGLKQKRSFALNTKLPTRQPTGVALGLLSATGPAVHTFDFLMGMSLACMPLPSCYCLCFLFLRQCSYSC